MTSPDKTLPIRAYPFPSCGACLRIAERHGFGIGHETPVGPIEAFTHTGGEIVGLVATEEGYIVNLTLQELVFQAA